MPKVTVQIIAIRSRPISSFFQSSIWFSAMKRGTLKNSYLASRLSVFHDHLADGGIVNILNKCEYSGSLRSIFIEIQLCAMKINRRDCLTVTIKMAIFRNLKQNLFAPPLPILIVAMRHFLIKITHLRCFRLYLTTTIPKTTKGSNFIEKVLQKHSLKI